MKKEKYTQHLLNSVLQSREVAVREIKTLGVDIEQELVRIDNWFSLIEKWIKNNAPNYFVKYIEITEDSASKIAAINYVYFRRNEIVSAASIKVLIDF